MVDTLGEVITCALALVAVIVVPAAIARAWWPEVRRAIASSTRALVDLFVMSPADEQSTSIEQPATLLPATPREVGQGFAKPGNAVNDSLTGNMLPDEVREVVRFWAMVEAAERVVQSGKMGQVEAVETIFGCKRSGRPESTYARAVAALKARSDTAYREQQARLLELQAAAVEE